MALTVDQMLEKIGEFYKFQWLLLGIFGYAVFALDALPIMIVTFITAEPQWECVGGYNTSVCNFTKPIGLTSDDYEARCDMPRDAWRYVDGFTSTVTEYDLVCEKSLLQSVAQSCYWVGMLLGLIAGGYLADKFGRKIIFYIGSASVIIATWIMIFPESFIVFIVCRVFIGLGSGFRNATSFVMLTEFTTEKHRAKIGVGSFYFWVAGLMLLPLIGYFVTEWRYFLLGTACFAIPCLFTWWFIPESVRWLLLRGRKTEAKEQLEKVAAINGREMPNESLQNIESSGETGSFKHLFFNWKVAKITLISWNLWFANSLVYYGVSYGSVDLGGNRYVNFALTSIVELPSNILCIFVANRYGRKKTVIVGLIVACIAALISVAIPDDQSNDGYTGGRIFLAVLAKFFINMAFSGIYIWSTELFPTFIRGMGVSTSSSAARIGSFSASYIVWLIRIHSILPFGIMGIICLEAAIVATFLPETNGRPTIETLQEMVNYEEEKRRSVVMSEVIANSKAEINENTHM
ncbi:solute carrier family 22 member 5-like [Dendronephthya gigantea]|uniref:solute carrier family 22 member 5-like n=1 Tax=Dendronephthya gigantea TaxID=151771 RepID=UPI00106971C5|nr:solute carrier family 22 member 5-like [Dendronephthya gigantea]XP_028398781.1 solute carrier family 22 member 5-like [Dendronephthya gigantea]